MLTHPMYVNITTQPFRRNLIFLISGTYRFITFCPFTYHTCFLMSMLSSYECAEIYFKCLRVKKSTMWVFFFFQSSELPLTKLYCRTKFGCVTIHSLYCRTLNFAFLKKNCLGVPYLTILAKVISSCVSRLSPHKFHNI